MAERVFDAVLGAQRVGAAYLSRFLIRRFKKGSPFENISFLSTQQTYQDLFTRNLIFAYLNLGIALAFGSSRYLHIGCMILWFLIQFGSQIYRWIRVFGVYFSATLENHDIPILTHETFEFDGIENYKHKLKLDQTGFRCLLLKSAKNETDVVRCKLFSISITTPPVYDALSYHWGPRSALGQEQYILCGVEKILVSDNCMSALLHLRQRHSDRLLWIDAICIDQSNNEEKDQQVQVMGQIYQNAASVIVWLGSSTSESRLAFKYLAAILQLSRFPKFIRRWCTERLYEKIRSRKHGHTIVQLSHRSWFSRVWTVQEVALAKQGCCSIVCGKDIADFDHLNGNLWIAASELNIREEYPLNDMLYHQSKNLFRFELRSAVLFNKPRNRPVAELMRKLAVFGATDPKDKVFGLYGILEKLGFEMPKPRYESSLDEIYWKSITAIIQHEPSLAFLSLASGVDSRIPNAPSWIPDFRKMNSFMSLDGSVKATKDSPPIFTIQNRDYELHVSGFIIETITDFSKRRVWEPEFGAIEVHDDRYFGLYDPEQCLPTIHALQEWTTFCITVGSRVSQKYGSTYETIMATVTQGNLSLLAASGRAYSDFFSVLCCTQPPWESMAEEAAVFFENARDDPQLRARFFDDPRWSSFVEDPYWLTMCAMKADDDIARVLHLVWAVARGNTVFETETGWFGLASHTLREGDVVALMSGMSLPAVLRPVLGTGERKFMFVGTAYVHGMMQGELWDESNTESLILI
ncbi:uncharacterized protein RCO7_02551 [Rhynchosporium graminicola]|uniref:Heterokaryon incompatibility domain-containing protein n=1 Tax=Rhynchosporium graminicola TaxID=2792576 RepID=A0A1E1JUD5_9HELO|nr:uncharacterized protein RCO7_02551 [Rhynchosporium commune]